LKEFFDRLKELYNKFDENCKEIVEGQCLKCALCCSSRSKFPPLSKLEEDFLSEYIKDFDYPDIETFKHFMIHREGSYCPYFNSDIKGCNVYSVRPIYCRMHGNFKFNDEVGYENCSFYGKSISVTSENKNETIKYIKEIMELRFFYDVVRASGPEEKIEALLKLGEEYTGQEEYLKAFTTYKEAEKIAPDDPRVLFNLGYVFRNISKLKEEADFHALTLAMNYMEKSVSYGGDKYFPYIYQNLGFIYLDLYLFEKADTVFQKAIEFEPHKALPYLGMALIAFYNGDKEKLALFCNRVLEIEPENSQAKQLMNT
jgi:tetratricopeptide (TPR) repeat protein